MTDTDHMSIAAAIAFEDYYALGPGRSTQQLWEQYENLQDIQQAPCKSIKTILTWSAKYGWAEVVRERDKEDAFQRRILMQARQQQFRNDLLDKLEIDIRNKLNSIVEGGDSTLANTAADLERVTKLYFQLGDAPLAERIQQELSTPNGLQQEVTVHDLLANPEATLLLGQLEIALAAPGGQDPGRVGDGDHGGTLALPPASADDQPEAAGDSSGPVEETDDLHAAETREE